MIISSFRFYEDKSYQQASPFGDERPFIYSQVIKGFRWSPTGDACGYQVRGKNFLLRSTAVQ